VLDNVATQVRPLQQKGIKVLLSILGNHQGAGFANFPSQAAADAFAQELADAVNQYGLDGIDFDDEYAEYGNNGTGQPNDSSFVYLVSALRQKLPNKIITLYDIGPSAARLSYNGQSVANTFNYAWNPYYGTWSVPRGPSDKAKLSPAAVSYTATSSATAASFAQRTKDEGYGVFLTYNLTSANTASYISAFTSKLYGSNAVYTPCFPVRGVSCLLSVRGWASNGASTRSSSGTSANRCCNAHLLAECATTSTLRPSYRRLTSATNDRVSSTTSR
jgi:hypothetical protein